MNLSPAAVDILTDLAAGKHWADTKWAKAQISNVLMNAKKHNKAKTTYQLIAMFAADRKERELKADAVKLMERPSARDYVRELAHERLND